MKVHGPDGGIDDVRCNRCSGSCMVRLSAPGDDGIALWGFEGFVERTVLFGYGSHCDGEEYTFSLCEACVLALFTQFALPPERRDNIYAYRDELNPHLPAPPERVQGAIEKRADPPRGEVP